MKKILSTFLALVMVALMLVSLVSCSSYGAIERDFEKEGWVLKSEESGEIKTDKGVITYTIHTFQPENDGGILGSITSAVKTAVIWEFASEVDLEEAIGESATLKGLITDLKNSDYVNGNCVLVTVSGNAKEIFTKSK